MTSEREEMWKRAKKMFSKIVDSMCEHVKTDRERAMFNAMARPMSERSKMGHTIWLTNAIRYDLEKLPRTPKLQKKIDQLANLEEELKQAWRDHDFMHCLEQSAIREAMERTEKHRKEQQQKRALRQRWNGKTREELSARDRKIVDDYYKPRKTHLTINSFAEAYFKKHPDGPKPRTLRLILENAVGNLPG